MEEPAAKLALWVHALADGDDDPLLDVQHPHGFAVPGLISKVAKAREQAERMNRTSLKKLRSWRARGCPFDAAYLPASRLLRGRGVPPRPDPSDASKVALLWPFSPFFVELRDAVADGASTADPPWSCRLDEVTMMVLLSNAVEFGLVHAVLTGLSQRALAEGTGERDSNAMDEALQKWLRRRSPLRTYRPRARTEDEAGQRVFRYVRNALLRGYSRAKGTRSDIPRSTAKRWAAAGLVGGGRDVEAVRNEMRRRMTHEGPYPSEAKVAARLGCARSTVQKYRAEAERRAGVSVVKGDNSLGYPPEVVGELRELLRKPGSTPRVIKRPSRR